MLGMLMKLSSLCHSNLTDVTNSLKIWMLTLMHTCKAVSIQNHTNFGYIC